MATRLVTAMSNFYPLSEWTQDKRSYILRIYLPGFIEEQIEVKTHSSGTLKVRGQRCSKISRPIQFQLVYLVPPKCKVSKICYHFSGEVLSVTMPKESLRFRALPERKTTIIGEASLSRGETALESASTTFGVVNKIVEKQVIKETKLNTAVEEMPQGSKDYLAPGDTKSSEIDAEEIRHAKDANMADAQWIEDETPRKSISFSTAQNPVSHTDEMEETKSEPSTETMPQKGNVVVASESNFEEDDQSSSQNFILESEAQKIVLEIEVNEAKEKFAELETMNENRIQNSHEKEKETKQETCSVDDYQKIVKNAVESIHRRVLVETGLTVLVIMVFGVFIL